MLASNFGTGQVFLSMLYFFLFFIWLWLLITVFADLFSSHDLSGWAKALWVVVLILIPFLGVLIYLIVRGHKMQQHAVQAAQDQDAAMRAYIREVAKEESTPPAPSSPSSESGARGHPASFTSAAGSSSPQGRWRRRPRRR